MTGRRFRTNPIGEGPVCARGPLSEFGFSSPQDSSTTDQRPGDVGLRHLAEGHAPQCEAPTGASRFTTRITANTIPAMISPNTRPNNPDSAVSTIHSDDRPERLDRIVAALEQVVRAVPRRSPPDLR